MKTTHDMKIKLLRLLFLTALALMGLGIFPLVLAQTDISPASTSIAQPTPSPEMQGANQTAGMDSMKRMADMCQEMMNSEKAAMPFVIGVSVLFGLLLFIALLLFVMLEIQWIKYWRRILKSAEKAT